MAQLPNTQENFGLYLLQQATLLRLIKRPNFSYVWQKCKVIISLYFTVIYILPQFLNPLPCGVMWKFLFLFVGGGGINFILKTTARF